MPPEVRDNIARSHAASKSLIHVINDLLDLTRAERGQDLSLQEPFNFPETLNEALEIHKEEAQRRGMTLEVIESPSGSKFLAQKRSVIPDTDSELILQLLQSCSVIAPRFVLSSCAWLRTLSSIPPKVASWSSGVKHLSAPSRWKARIRMSSVKKIFESRSPCECLARCLAQGSVLLSIITHLVLQH